MSSKIEPRLQCQACANLFSVLEECCPHDLMPLDPGAIVYRCDRHPSAPLRSEGVGEVLCPLCRQDEEEEILAQCGFLLAEAQKAIQEKDWLAAVDLCRRAEALSPAFPGVEKAWKKAERELEKIEAERKEQAEKLREDVRSLLDELRRHPVLAGREGTAVCLSRLEMEAGLVPAGLPASADGCVCVPDRLLPFHSHLQQLAAAANAAQKLPELLARKVSLEGELAAAGELLETAEEKVESSSGSRYHASILGSMFLCSFVSVYALVAVRIFFMLDWSSWLGRMVSAAFWPVLLSLEYAGKISHVVDQVGGLDSYNVVLLLSMGVYAVVFFRKRIDVSSSSSGVEAFCTLVFLFCAYSLPVITTWHTADISSIFFRGVAALLWPMSLLVSLGNKIFGGDGWGITGPVLAGLGVVLAIMFVFGYSQSQSKRIAEKVKVFDEDVKLKKKCKAVLQRKKRMLERSITKAQASIGEIDELLGKPNVS